MYLRLRCEKIINSCNSKIRDYAIYSDYIWACDPKSNKSIKKVNKCIVIDILSLELLMVTASIRLQFVYTPDKTCIRLHIQFRYFWLSNYVYMQF